MGTKIQDYDLEAPLRVITKDIRDARAAFGKDVKVVMQELKTGVADNVTSIDALEVAAGLLDDGLTAVDEKVGILEGLVGYSSAGEEDDETFTYDPVTDDIVKHEVHHQGVLKFTIDYSYTDGNISQAVKTYMDGEDTVTVTTTFSYNAKGNVSQMSHRRVVTPPAQP